MALFVQFVLLAASILGNNVLAIDNYCSMNNYANTGPHMQLTKEANFEEFAMVGKFKALHCCAKGYKTIEWYKDSKVYPWSASISKLILFPEGANQTIYVQSVREEDAGTYTCVLRNDTMIIRHNIQLRIFEKVPDDPKITYISDDKEIALGQELRLFCEAFAGRVDLPDARNEAVWRRANYNGSMENDTRIIQRKNTREEEQTFGTYLIIDNVQKKDIGAYTCKISNPGSSIEKIVHVREKIQVVYANPNPIPTTKLILFISCITTIIIVLTILNIKYGLALRVRFKDTFGPLEEAQGKTSDAMIVYSEKDSDLALGVLLPTLENRYNYKCASRVLPSTTNTWYTDLKGPAQNTKRLIAILSPSALNENWDNDNLLQALKQLQSAGPPICPIALKELPTKDNEVKNAQGETLTSLSRALNIIVWDRNNDDKFWLSLRLMLPPNRRVEAVANSPQGSNPSRLTSDSQESLDNLV